LSGPVITVIGGGVSVAKLCQALAQRPGLPPSEIRLVARRYDRLCVIAAACQRIFDSAGPDWDVRAIRSVEDACVGADIIVLLIREGGLTARAHDESFPRAFGLTGDEGLGAGGIANALRTIPELRRLTEIMARSAPGARVLNMIAPLGVTTRLLLDHGINAIGVCELPLTTERKLRASPRFADTTIRYAGFNHWGWFWAEDESAADLLGVAVETGLANRDTVDAFGAVPLRYYYEIFDPNTAERLGFRRSPTRAIELSLLGERIFSAFKNNAEDLLSAFAERPTPWFNEALVPIIAAFTAGDTYEGFANVRNEHHLTMVSKDVVVETRAKITGGAIEDISGGDPPARVASFLAGVGKSEEFVYRAATTSTLDEQFLAVASALEALGLQGNSSREELAKEIVRASCVKGD